MKKFPALFALLCSCFLSACATNPPAALELQKPVSRDVVTVPERMSFVQYQGLLNIRWEYGLMPGRYVAESTNSHGTFYRGQGRPVWARGGTGTGPVQVSLGGIWVPKNEDEFPRLYLIRENGVYTTQSLDLYAQSYMQNTISSGAPVLPTAVGTAIGMAIVEAMIAADAGTIYIFDPSPDRQFGEQLRSAFAARKPLGNN